jgi:kynureninase
VIEEQWAGDLIASWWNNGWLEMPLTVGDSLAPLLGASAGEVAVHDSTTVCLFQLTNVALDLTRGRVVAVADTEFPTDRYVADGIARLRPGVEVRRSLDDLDGVDVVVRSHVDYRTAEIAPLADETARAAAAGAITVWDLSHAAGVLTLDLNEAGVQLAAGCTYKFLNGGPGAPAFTYVNRSIHDEVVQPIWGWFGQRDQFAMDAPFDPRPGIGRLLNGTPAILSLVAAHQGIQVSAEAGIGAIAEKARTLGSFAIDVATDLGLTCTTAAPPASSGGHISIIHPEATRLQAALSARKVIVDKRDPDVLRFGLSPLTTRFVDAFDGLATLAGMLDT